MVLSRFSRTFLCVGLLLLAGAFYLLVSPPSDTYLDPFSQTELAQGGVENRAWGLLGGSGGAKEEQLALGEVIMPKARTFDGLDNETAKAELGRATWKLLHLITLRFPDDPSQEQREALRTYFHLFSRLYPCGECAEHFQAMLREYPPQTSSRKSASFWLCHIHNLVNARLGKEEFDCLKLDETYDCGCGPEKKAEEGGKEKEGVADGKRDEVTGAGLLKGG